MPAHSCWVALLLLRTCSVSAQNTSSSPPVAATVPAGPEEAAAAPSAEPDCGSWIVDKDYFGNDIGNRPTRSRAQCVEFCLSNPNCNGASFSDIDSVCYLKAIPDGARKVLETSASTFKFCPGQAEEITTGADVPVVATTGDTGDSEADSGQCGVWFEGFTFEGINITAAVALGEPSSEAHRVDCYRRCLGLTLCNSIVYTLNTQRCAPMVIQQATRAKEVPGDEKHTVVLRVCKPGEETACGEWIKGGDFFGNDIQGESRLAVNKEDCRAVCLEVPECNAATYKPLKQQCWVKKMPEGELPIEDFTGETIRLCPNETEAARSAAAEETASRVVQDDMEGSCTSDTDCGNEEDCRSGVCKGNGLGAGEIAAIVAACCVAVFVPAGLCVLLLVNGRRRQHHGKRERGTSTEEHLNSAVPTTDTRRSDRLSIPWDVTCVTIPADGADREALVRFLHNQLDRIEACTEDAQSEIMDGLVLSGSGPRERLQGGQAVVQMAHHPKHRMEVAIKFFITKSAFLLEKTLYTTDSLLGQFLPQVRTIVDNTDKRFIDPAGHTLPPCIVMERGESLDLWSNRNAPDRAQAFTVIYHIAQRLQELHASGYVHRDLKPGNVMWLPRTNRWTVIDFGCTARSGHTAPIGFTLKYTAPEVVKARRNWQEEMVAEPSLDAWSLGVMAFELATGTSTFPVGMQADQKMDQIEGVNGEMLPWEGERLTDHVKSQLRLFQGSLLQLLHRDPHNRPSMKDFCRTCSHILGDQTATEGVELQGLP